MLRGHPFTTQRCGIGLQLSVLVLCCGNQNPRPVRSASGDISVPKGVKEGRKGFVDFMSHFILKKAPASLNYVESRMRITVSLDM